MTSAVTADAGRIQSLGEIEGRIAEAWVQCQEGIRVFAVGPYATKTSSRRSTKSGQHEEPPDHRL